MGDRSLARHRPILQRVDLDLLATSPEGMRAEGLEGVGPGRRRLHVSRDEDVRVRRRLADPLADLLQAPVPSISLAPLMTNNLFLRRVRIEHDRI